MQNLPLIFVLPAGSQDISGGNLYNRALLEALGPNVLAEDEARALARFARGEPAVYVFDSLSLPLLVQLPAARARQYLVLLVHHLGSFELRSGPEAAEAERAALARCDAFVATSRFTEQQLCARGFPGEHIVTLPPAAPQVVAAEARRPVPPFVFLAVGNLIERKGYLELLAELASRATAADTFCLQLAGRADLEPAYAQACLARAQSAPLQGRVQYLGSVAPENLAAFYGAASCFVSASSMETFGMALQEARAYSLPIVARDGGYVRHHFTHGHDGLLCDSVAALCEAMLALVRDPSRMHALCLHAQRSPDTNSDYTWQTAAAQLHQGLGRLFAG